MTPGPNAADGATATPPTRADATDEPAATPSPTGLTPRPTEHAGAAPASRPSRARRPAPARRRRPPSRLTPDVLEAGRRAGAREGLEWLGREPESKASLLYRVLRLLARFILFGVFRFRIETSGQEHLPRGGGYLLIGAAHRGWIDPFVVMHAIPRSRGPGSSAAARQRSRPARGRA